MEQFNKLPQISASKLKVFRTCARQYQFKYIIKPDSRPTEDKNIGALMGSALHKSIELYYRNGANPMTTFQNYMMRTLGEWQEQNLKINGEAYFSKSLKEGRAILETYNWDRFDPLALELYFARPFPSVEDPVCKIVGYIDHIDKKNFVVDHKSQRAMPSQDELNHDPQFLIYAWVYLQMEGTLPDAVYWNNLRSGELIAVDVLTDFDYKIDQLAEDIYALLENKHYQRRQMDKVCLRECSFFENCYGVRVKNQSVEDSE